MLILRKTGFLRPEYSYKRSAIKVGYNGEIRKMDFELFENNILLHIPSLIKKNSSQDLVKGNRIRDHDIVYFSVFMFKKNLTIDKMAFDFGINSATMSSIVVKFLDQSLITRKGTGQGSDPFRHSATKKGLKWFLNNIEQFKFILYELKRLGYYKRSFKKETMKVYHRLKDLYGKNVEFS